MPSAIPFRPRSASEVIDAAFQLLRGQFGPFALIAAVVLIPGLLVNVINTWTLPAGVVPGTPEAMRETFTGTRLALVLPLLLASFLWMLVGFGALVAAASEAYMGRPVDPAAAFRRAFSRAGRLIGGHLLAYLAFFGVFGVVGAVGAVAVPLLGAIAGLIIFVGMIGSVIWACVAVARWFTITPVLTLEDVGAAAALGRSSQLSEGSRKRILGIAALLFTISIVVVMVAAGLAVMLPGSPHFSGVVTNLFYVPLYPLFTCVMTVLYYDLRIRKEGYDIELMAQELGEADRQPAY